MAILVALTSTPTSLALNTRTPPTPNIPVLTPTWVTCSGELEPRSRCQDVRITYNHAGTPPPRPWNPSGGTDLFQGL